MNHYIKYLGFLFFGSTLFCGNAIALTPSTGLTVTNVVTSIGGGYIIFSGALAGASNCNGPTNMIAFSNDADGKAFLSVALVAFTTGKKVAVWSEEVCATHQSNLELLKAINIGQ